jgi:hypothetical protein
MPAGFVEIVGVLIMAEQHGIDRTDLRCRQRRTRGFPEHHVRQLIFTGCIERRVGEKPKSTDFDEDGRTADQRDPGRAHDILLKDHGQRLSLDVNAQTIPHQALGCGEAGRVTR